MGAFEVKFNGELLFSKKTSNTWPNFYDLLTQINRKVNGE